ncbi:MAG: hypothetical protein JO159_05180 [Acidobacteria bacterium]|nr:hypothetical protein [Acidobacteriota bacterium]MBV9622805.1 hypothetical protein [Acidobacteriota bacterium]
MEVAGYFELDHHKAHKIAGEVGTAVAGWRHEAARQGLNSTEIDRMDSAFEHDDLNMAKKMKARA